jgi:hypothetical protein
MAVTTKALDDAGQRISRYLLAQFCLNVGFGVVIGIGLYFIGVPHALLWGFLASVLRYIPYVGPWIAAIFPVTLSLLISPGWVQPILVVLLFVTFELISNLIVEPLVYGQSIGVSQAALIVAIAFWTWLWGPMGLVLAAPLTVCLVVLGKYVPQLKFFDILLGDEPPLSAEMNFYQRLLARDPDEASDIVREQLQTLSLGEVFDRVLIPAMILAKRDEASDRLASEEAEYIVHVTKEIVDEQDVPEVTDESLSAEDTARQEQRPKLRILGCPASDDADEAALVMLGRLLDSKLAELDVVNTLPLVSEIVAKVEAERPSIVCIATLPPGGLARTRLLCKRLRSSRPGLKIVVGRWGLRSGADSNREQFLAVGADYFGTTLEETVTQLVQLSQLLRPPSEVPRDVEGAVPESRPVPAPHSLKAKAAT